VDSLTNREYEGKKKGEGALCAISWGKGGGGTGIGKHDFVGGGGGDAPFIREAVIEFAGKGGGYG